MRAIALLQLGDIHFPDNLSKSNVDFKDDSFPQELRNLIGNEPLKGVMRRIVQTQHDAILLCGDLTTQGNIGSYERCIQWLLKALNLASIAPDRIHVVPGNHDVDRKAVDGQNLFKKFEPFSALWHKYGLPILTVDAARRTRCNLEDLSGGIEITSVNSSLGCGERWFPDDIQSKMSSLLDEYVKEVGSDKSFEITGRALDTPAILGENIECICECVRNLDSKIVPVILAHHNLLPQALLRIDLYTEMINGGGFRSRLCALGKTILYCHGHIHENPVEIIEDPRKDGSRLVCISAPELSKGFNLLKIDFSDEGIALGCTVTAFETRHSDGNIEECQIRIPLVGSKKKSQASTTRLSGLLQLISHTGTRFEEVRKVIKPIALRKSRQLGDLILEAEWLGYIAVENREQDSMYWHLRRLG